MPKNKMVRIVYNACYGGFSLSVKAKERYRALKGESQPANGESQPANWHHYEGLQRHDPILLQVIDEIGLDAASGNWAELAIRELPRGTKYYINEYDGLESVMTPKDIKWSIAGE
jgi:hypothetical protein